MNLALFDFDGTITVKGTYPEFLRFCVRPARQIVGGVALSPLFAGYYAGVISDRLVRPPMSWISFVGEDVQRIRTLGERFAADVLPGLIRPVARERLDWHQARGDRIVIVSASLDVYLGPWCRAQGVDVICTQLESREGVLTGRYAGGDCCGAEKSRRIRERYAIEDHEVVYAYGDTEEDREMLEMAHRRFFRWEEVRDVPVASRVTRRGDGGV